MVYYALQLITFVVRYIGVDMKLDRKAQSPDIAGPPFVHVVDSIICFHIVFRLNSHSLCRGQRVLEEPPPIKAMLPCAAVLW